MLIISDKKEAIVGEHFKAGDKVQWHSSQGTVHGVIKKKLTAPRDIKVHHVAAPAAQKASALTKG